MRLLEDKNLQVVEAAVASPSLLPAIIDHIADSADVSKVVTGTIYADRRLADSERLANIIVAGTASATDACQIYFFFTAAAAVGR